MPREQLPYVICLAGPTGSGKTALALEFAKKLPCEIINADSRQLYADFPILSAQPEENEKNGVPHHLYGFLQSSEKCDAMTWTCMAAGKARSIWNSGKLPVLVGGTGFYFETFLNGLSPMPKIPPDISRSLAARMEAEGADMLYAELGRLDAEYQTLIHPHDRQRILRALEVYEASGKTFSWWRKKSREGMAARGILFSLDITLDKLSPLLLQRIKTMLEKGAITEIAKAHKNCPDMDAPGWSCIGARECLELLQGKKSENEAIIKWHAATRAYAKRQLTWFRPRKYANHIEAAQFINAALAQLSSNFETRFLTA